MGGAEWALRSRNASGAWRSTPTIAKKALVGLAEGRVGSGDGVAVHRGSPGPAFRHGALNRPHRPLDPGAPGADHTPLIATWAAAPLWHVPAP